MGMEVIPLKEEEFNPKTGQKKELPDLHPKQTGQSEEKKEGQDMMFRKSKTNNFFSIDEDADQIQPFEDESDQLSSPVKAETEQKQGQSSAQKTQPDEIAPEDDILAQIAQTLLKAEETAKENKNNALPSLNELPNLNDL